MDLTDWLRLSVPADSQPLASSESRLLGAPRQQFMELWRDPPEGEAEIHIHPRSSAVNVNETINIQDLEVHLTAFSRTVLEQGI